MIANAAIREYLPGPVKVVVMRLRTFIRDAPKLRTRAVVKAIDFMGRRVADAILQGMTEERNRDGNGNGNKKRR